MLESFILHVYLCFFIIKLIKYNNNFSKFIYDLYHDKNACDYIKNTNYVDFNFKSKILTTFKGNSVAFSWKNQCAWLPNDEIYFVGKIESLEKDFNLLANKLNFKYIYSDKIMNKTQYSNIELDDDTKNKIYNLYEKDFIRFNYEK